VAGERARIIIAQLKDLPCRSGADDEQERRLGREMANADQAVEKKPGCQGTAQVVFCVQWYIELAGLAVRQLTVRIGCMLSFSVLCIQ
jgi:hypothetical protein